MILPITSHNDIDAHITLVLDFHFYQQPNGDGEGAANGIGSEVEPFARTGGSTLFLHYLDDAAHNHREEPGKEEQLAPLHALMAAQILYPDD